MTNLNELDKIPARDDEGAFTRLGAAPAYRMIYEAIEQRIMSGQLKSGDLLPTEGDLAAKFGINRSTLREGIRLLEQSGLVQRRSAKRLYVTLPHMTDLASRASRALRLHQVTFKELWEASMATEPVACRYAAERITAGEIIALEENLHAMKAAIGNTEESVRLDIEFHDIIAQASRNRALILAREPISLLFMPAGKIILARLHTEDRVVDAHHMIIQAFKRHQPRRAETWMRKHIEDFRRGFERTRQDMDSPLDSLLQTDGRLPPRRRVRRSPPG
jgi:GntR family transcriptional repressor for pyruvate dehydrogenase complex